MQKTIENLVVSVLGELGLEPVDFVVEHPTDHSHGDYSSNIAMVLAKRLGKNPRELAEEIKSHLDSKKNGEIEKIEVAGAGFINFYLTKEFFNKSIQNIINAGEKFGGSDIGKGKKMVIEYSSPNIAKPFSIGHLRSTVIGDAIANIRSFLGFEVIRDNHLGDWGTQFGKMIVALKKWGNEDEIASSENPVKLLVNLYVKFHEEAEKNEDLESEAKEWFKKLEDGDEEARRIWKKCIEWSMTEFNSLYKRLGVKFDTSLGESFFEDKMSSVISELEEKGFAKESEGALLVFFPNDVLPPYMIRKSDGTTLYSTRDLAADKYRLETYGKDVLIVNEVGIEQSLHFKQLFETEKILGWVSESQRVHVAHGLYRFPEGKMSTRKGNVIWLEDILKEAVERSALINPDTAEEVGIGAIKFNDLKREAKQDIVFNWEEVINIKGDSGPYLQYTHARTSSILEKALQSGAEYKTDILEGRKTHEVEKLLYRFPEVVERAGLEYAPHYITSYLTELAGSYNNFYANERVISEDKESPYRLAITKAFNIVMGNGLNLLGIAAPEKM